MNKIIYKKILSFILLLILFFIFTPEDVYAWKFSVLGDTRPGSTYDHSQNVYGISFKSPNISRALIFENGDLTGDGTDSQWANYRSIISTPLGIPIDNSGWLNGYGVPKIISAVGNHDTHQSGWQTRWQTYLPAQAGLTAYADIPAHAQGLYGSVKYGNAIFVWLDYYSQPTGQETFLANTLSRAKNDPQVLWKFVTYHSPAVSCGGSHGDWSKGKTWHDSYFYLNGVDMVFAGDNHYYERTCPFGPGLANSGTNEQSVCDSNNLGNTLVNPNGVIHVVSGGGGAELYSVASCPFLAKNQNGQDAAFSLHEFMDIEINGNSLHAVVYDTDTGIGTSPVLTSNQASSFNIIDDFTITKAVGPTPTPGGVTITPTKTPTYTPTPTPTKTPTYTPTPTNTLTLTPTNTIVPTASCTPNLGDTDNNKIINEIDYATWLYNYTQSFLGPEKGDFNCSNKVDGMDYVIWLNNLTTITPTQSITPSLTPKITLTPTVTPKPTPSLPPPSGSRITKYYGVDRLVPGDFSTLSQYHTNTVITAFDVNESQSTWQNYFTEAQKYNANIVVLPTAWSDKRPNCSWGAPYPVTPVAGEEYGYIIKILPMLDYMATQSKFIGIINAHEPFWTSCPMTVAEMTEIKNQIKTYLASKGRNDVKVWNYVDNVDNHINSGHMTISDIPKIMDVAITWQHCIANAEGPCLGDTNSSSAIYRIRRDRTRIDQANSTTESNVELVFLFQTFYISGSSYSRMPTSTEMFDYGCDFLQTNALDGFIWYTWGADWYSGDLDDYPTLWPAMNTVYNSCVIK